MRLALAPALILSILVLVPAAMAASAQVSLEPAGTVWNGESRVALESAPESREVRVWVPAGARLHSVFVRFGEGGAPASWAAAGADALLVLAPADATAVVVRFDVPDRWPWLVRYVAPPGTEDVSFRIREVEGRAVESPDVEFLGGAAGRTVVSGDVIAIRVVDAGRVGELSLFATVGGLSLLVLLGTLAWHAVRPPLQGRVPERFLDHLVEVQARLLPVGILFALFDLLYFIAGLRLLEVGGVPLVAPTVGEGASIAARAFDALAERLVPANVQLVVLRPADAVLAQVGMALFLSLATVLPLLVYEVAAFLGPGLEPRERRVALRVLPLVTGLFVTGATFAYLVMAPLMFRTLYDYAPTIGATALLAVGELVGFALLVVIAMGIAFELPVLMYVLARLGLVRAGTFGRYVRHAILVIVVLAGLITPDPSVVSQLLLAVPITALYLVGIAAAAWGERARPTP